jgi:hypothetical protein
VKTYRGVALREHGWKALFYITIFIIKTGYIRRKVKKMEAKL